MRPESRRIWRFLLSLQPELRIVLHVLVLGMGLVLAASFILPASAIESGRLHLTPRCPSQVETGEPCLFCGMTRSFLAMSHGRWGRAAGYNALGPWLYLALWLGVLADGWILWRKGCIRRENLTTDQEDR